MLKVDGGGYAAAQGALRTGNQVAALQCDSLSAKLDAYAGMAGDDATSANFAESYDAAAAEALRTIADLTDSFAGLGRLVAASGANHEAAEAANAGLDSGAFRYDGDSMPEDDYARASPRQPPTVLGAQPATFDDKRQWILDHIEGFVWPGADTERLRDAAQTWRTAADGVTDLTTYCDVVVDHLAAQESPEIPLALAALDELRSLVESTSGDLAAIAGACDGYAAQVEDTHARLHALLDEILQMVVEGIVISVAIGVITGGAGAAAGGAATVARVAAQSPRFHAIISALRAAAAPTTQAVRTTRETLRATRFRLEKFTHAQARMRTERGAIVLPSGRVFRSIGGRGWLRAHEHSGSHTITRHVGKTNAYLRARLRANEQMKTASTFVDEREAEKAVSKAIRSQYKRVEDWLDSPGSSKLELEVPAPPDIGRSMTKDGILLDPKTLRVVLTPDPKMPDGFRLLTAFPKP